MKITFLGTNGWYSNKLGNTPSVLVESKDCYVIFDAGYGIALAPDYMKKDKPVYLFISHMHLDHTFYVATERHELSCELSRGKGWTQHKTY